MGDYKLVPVDPTAEMIEQCAALCDEAERIRMKRDAVESDTEKGSEASVV